VVKKRKGGRMKNESFEFIGEKRGLNREKTMYWTSSRTAPGKYFGTQDNGMTSSLWRAYVQALGFGLT